MSTHNPLFEWPRVVFKTKKDEFFRVQQDQNGNLRWTINGNKDIDSDLWSNWYEPDGLDPDFITLLSNIKP